MFKFCCDLTLTCCLLTVQLKTYHGGWCGCLLGGRGECLQQQLGITFRSTRLEVGLAAPVKHPGKQSAGGWLWKFGEEAAFFQGIAEAIGAHGQQGNLSLKTSRSSQLMGQPVPMGLPRALASWGAAGPAVKEPFHPLRQPPCAEEPVPACPGGSPHTRCSLEASLPPHRRRFWLP